MAASEYIVSAANLRAMADAIREKTGQAGLITPNQMAAAIAAIPGGGGVEVEPLSVTENGTYAAQEGVAYSPVTVAVPIPQIHYTDTGHCYTENMVIQLGAGTAFGAQYSGATNLKTVSVYPTLSQFTNTMGSQSFYNCTSLESATIAAWEGITYQTFRNCTALKTVQLGDIGFPIKSVGNECFYGDRQADLTITIFVADETAIPLSGSPWGANNATIIYRSSTTGDVRTA